MNDLAVVTKAIPDEESSRKDAPDAYIFPTSFAQRRLWFLEQLDPTATLYNFPEAFRIHGRVSPALLERSFAIVIDRHEILRTTFRLLDGEPMQVVAEAMDFQLPVVDLTSLEPGAREAELTRLIRNEANLPYDLACGPLIRPSLVQLSADEQVLIMSLHHIVTDAWSQEVLMRELTAAYSALSVGREPELPALPIQYADFAVWQREAMSGEPIKKSIAHWRKRLAGLAPLQLPGRASGLARKEGEGGTCAFDLPPELTASLKALARPEGATLFMTLLAGWQALLARFTGQADIAVGSPISDRSRTETEGLIGFFLNTLILRTDLSGDPTVRDVILRARDTTLEAFGNQDLPFEVLVEELHPKRLRTETPLLRVMFVMVNGAEKSWAIPGGVIEPMKVEESKAKFDLMLHLRDTARGIQGALVYDKALFDPAMARRIASHYETLLSAMAANPTARIHSLPLITANERERILVTWNDTATPYPADRTIHGLFREQARLNPTAIAVEDGRTQITYGDLDRQSDAVAAGLIATGVKPGETVAIGLPRSARLIAGILGILKTGAAYVPLDSSYPPARLEVMLRQSEARYLIGEGKELPGSAAAALSIETLIATPIVAAPETGASTDAAYIMFTSGSTGTPKGVRVLHRGISRLVINTDYVQFNASDIVAHASNTSFDASTFEIWGALLHGARLVIVPRETLISPQELASFIRERRLSVLFLTTPLFHQFAREIPDAFGSLRYLVAGGDALQPDAARAVLKAAAPAHLVNGYGPTEATTFAICHEVTDVPPDAVSIPIGRPIANTRAYILDAAMQPVPVEIAGELYLGGPGIAGGYLHNDAATAASFLADPFSDDPAARLYKTGDLARWREDGLIDFLGRADNQVKIRGFRVEPGEIETALLRHPRVRQAVVAPRADSTGQKQLVAYVVLHPGPALESQALREHLLASLPDYMAPAAFAYLETLPLNANGKIDMAELAAEPLAESRRLHAGPATWMEATLVDIWEEVLGKRQIGVTDDFFELGGHSLLAIRMLAEVQNRTGIKIAPRLLFEGATIRHLATAARRHDAVTRSAIVPVQTAGDRAPFFFLHGDFVEGGLYCVKMARMIGQDRPFYAIDPHGVHDEPPHSIEEMAASRLELVRKVSPRGPYVLGGFCNGGLIAFEMARQLEAAGEKISSLILLSVDGSNAEFSWLDRLIRTLPGRGDRKFRSFLEWRERILFARAAWKRQMDSLAAPVPLTQQPRRIARKLGRIVRKALGLMLPRPVTVAPGTDATQPEAAGMDIGLIYHQACTAYVPRPYRGPAHLLWPGEMTLRDPLAGWGRVMPQIKVQMVDGGHFSSLQGENLLRISEKIRACMLEDKA
jgi:amino acid adenylation domain-containing protein